MPQTILEYEIIDLIDDEANSFVYRAQKSETTNPVILKLPKNQYPSLRQLSRFRHEFEVTRDMDIVGIIKPIKLEDSRDSLALVLEDIGGTSLKNVLQIRQLSLNAFLRLAIQLTNILADIHQNKIIHKDIKPSNIIVNLETETIKITDFGIASRLPEESQQITHLNLLEGTLAYMAPEQTGRMNRSIDYRSDYYALGVTFYEMLTGQLPFPMQDPLTLLHAHIARKPTPPHEIRETIPTILSSIVLKLMAKTKEDRYQSAYGLRVDLQKCLTQLQTTGEIEPFILGQQDISRRFQIPQRLYGRTDDIATLLQSFERVQQGQGEMVLVSGQAGIGKSMLVNEIKRPVAWQNGYFTSGKFEQLQQIPYSAFVTAFRDLLRQILAESEVHLTQWREALLQALGRNGQIIIDLLPELELLIGPQPEVPALGPTEARYRFHLVWEQFIQVFAQPEHPLVIFLDDLQWADLPSLDLLTHLTAQSNNAFLFWIGAFRDNEVDAAHPLSLTLTQIQGAGTGVRHIRLGGLTIEHLNQLIGDTLHRSPDDTNPLAILLFRKTQGNPFFVLEFLKTLHQEQLLVFDVADGVWQWDLQAIQQMDVADNVITLMTNKVQDLPATTQTILQLASCLGNRFDLPTLATVYEASPAQTAVDLWPAVQEGLIIPLSDFGFWILDTDPEPQNQEPFFSRCRFLHDNVQQAAYALLAEHVKKETHYRIGQLLQNQVQNTPTLFDEKLFDITNHLNLSVDLFTEPKQTEELITFNLLAGKKAKRATAYETALTYLQAGHALLPSDSWLTNYTLTYSLNLELAESEYFNANFAQAEQTSNHLLQNAKTLADKEKVYNLKIILYTSLSQYEKAIQTGIEASQLLDYPLPASPQTIHIIQAFAQAKLYLRTKTDEDLLQLPALASSQKQAIASLLMNLTAPAFLSQPELAVVIGLKMLAFSLKYGASHMTPFSYVVYGAVNIGLGNIDEAHRFGQLAIQLNQQQDNRLLEHRIKFVFSSAINHWRTHAQTSLNYLEEGYRSALEAGDINFAEFCLLSRIEHDLTLGTPLPQLLERCEQYFQFFQRYKSIPPTDTLQGKDILIHQQVALSLQGATLEPGSLSTDTFDEKSLLTTGDNLEIYQYHVLKLPLLYLFGNYEEALQTAVQVETVIEDAIRLGDIRLSSFHLFYALVLTALYPQANTSEQKHYRKLLRNHHQKLKKWAIAAPKNHHHKQLLVTAEQLRILGQPYPALALFEEAAQSAFSHGYTQYAALANELAAKLCLEQQNEKLAKVYLQEARYHYLKWGAIAKAGLLTQTYGHLMLQPTQGTEDTLATLATLTLTSGQRIFDIMTILKAARTISREIILDKLLAQLMTIVAENAGAEKGFLILEQNKQLIIAAEMIADNVTILQALPLEQSQEVAINIVDYVARTQEAVVLNDATQEGLFTEDTYIQTTQVRSLLCLPLLNQGQLSAVLYLENNLTTGAFTADRLEILNFLSTQAAISIENARLYSQQIELTKAASNFVPHEFLQALNKERLTDVHLGDQVQAHMTVLFSDIRNFTSLSERMTPQENFTFINNFLQRLSPLIRRDGGFIDKFIGDGIMALFPSQADDALKAAIAMQHELRDYNQNLSAQGYPPIDIGIGLHTGMMMIGIVGEPQRLQSTVISDVVNTASRIEGLTKQFGIGIIASEQVISQLASVNAYHIRHLGNTYIKGRQESIAVSEIFDANTPEQITLKKETQTLFQEAINAYTQEQWSQAQQCLNQLLTINPADSVAHYFLQQVNTQGSPPLLP